MYLKMKGFAPPLQGKAEPQRTQRAQRFWQDGTQGLKPDPFALVSARLKVVP
jgi:hypothetical protein